MAPPDLPSFSLPALPPISDGGLGRLGMTCSTHVSNGGADGNQYEKLQHVGEALLASVVTTLLHDLFPTLSSESFLSLKSDIVADSTLAQVSARYNLPESIVAAATSHRAVEPRASALKAYIAAVFYDFLTSKVPGAYELDTESDSDETVSVAEATADAESVRDDLTVMSMAGEYALESVASDDTVEETMRTLNTLDVNDTLRDGYHDHVTKEAPEHHGSTVNIGHGRVSHFSSGLRLAPLPPLRAVALRTRGEAVDYVERWLRPLFIPIAHFTLERVRGVESVEE